MPDTQILSDEEVEEILARADAATGGPWGSHLAILSDRCVVHGPKSQGLCHTVRALRAAWCLCGHLKTSHDRFEDHDECRECPSDGPPDSCSEFRVDTSRPSLTKQLATAERELTNLRTDNAHLNERLSIQEGHCKRLQGELARVVRKVK